MVSVVYASVFMGIIVVVNAGGYWRFWLGHHPRSVMYANHNCRDYPVDGHKGGSFLASAHSIQQYDAINIGCQSSLCWIGLILDHKSRHLSYSWWDQTNIDENLITNSFIWCGGYPLIISNNTNTSYTYTNGSCWQNTFDVNHSITSWVCGPSRWQSLACWMTKCIVPAILIFPVFIYSLYILISLINNLYCIDHNYTEGEPSDAIKISVMVFMCVAIVSSLSAMLFFVLYGAGYIVFGILMPSTLPPDQGFPEIYTIAWIFENIAAGLFTTSYAAGYLHILLRLRNVFNENEIIRKVISCRFCLHFIGFLIILQPFFIEMLMLPNTNIAPMGYRNGIGPSLIAIVLAMDLAIVNGVLLYYYIKGLHTYAQYYFRGNMSPDSDQRIHELMVEATRYVILFGSFMLFDVVLACIGYFVVHHNYEDYSQCRYRAIVAELIFFIEIMLFLQSIHLSFKFKHETYTKRCKYCDQWVKKMCNKIVKERHTRIDQNDYVELSQEN